MFGGFDPWGWLSAALLLTGTWLSAKTGFVQVRRFPEAMRLGLGSFFRRGEGPGVSPLEAVCTALAGTVGTGNIAGVAVALALGGPGALFWMWVSMAVGMGLKYAEIALALRYREDRNGRPVGGPMYTIKNGLGRRYLPLARTFCLFGAAAGLGMGVLSQMASLCQTAGAARPLLGVGMALAVGLCLQGGGEDRGRRLSRLVPLMAGIYILGALAVILRHLPALPGALAAIFRGAMGWGPLLGGTAGSGLVRAMSWGVRRGLVSNEAGLGSSPIAHAAARTDDPGGYALMGVFEVFVDTGVVCTLTGLMLLTSGVELDWGAAGGAMDCARALGTVFGPWAGGFMWLCMGLFAFSSVLSWSIYGQECVRFLLGESWAERYLRLFPPAVLGAAFVPLPAALAAADLTSALMAGPNIVGLAALSKKDLPVFFRQKGDACGKKGVN